MTAPFSYPARMGDVNPIAGFAPDADPTSPGVLMDCSGFVPFESGFKGSPSPVSAGAAALPSDARGAVVAPHLDGTRRVLAGTQTNLYELIANVWTDVTRVVALATPGIATGTGSTTGGTLAPATYYVKISAIDANGNSTPAGVESAAVTTTGTTSSIAYTWTAVPSATSYRIYYGTAAGAENAYYTSATASYTLAATAGTAGTPPVIGDINYTGSVDSRWSICQFGDTTIAANLADTIQSSLSGAFADIAGAPKAKIVVSASNNFVLAFNTNDATYGSSPDRWWNCAQSDQTSWAPNITTQANTGRLVGMPGAIQAALPLGDYVVAYKDKAIFLGSFVGSPVVWQWNLIPSGEAGCVGQEAVCDIGGAHFIVGNDNFWLFNGSQVVPLAIGVVRQWFLNNSSSTYRYRTKAVYDKLTNLVRISYPSSTSTGACDACLVYHVIKKQWGRDDATVEAPLNYIVPGTTIDGLATLSATIDGLPNISFDSPYWFASGQKSAYFDGTHTLQVRSGASVASSFTTGDMGDDDMVSLMDRFRVRFSQSPASALATGYTKLNEGDSLKTGAASPINDGKFDLRQSGRYHRVLVSMTGDNQATGYAAKFLPAGAR